MNMDNVEGLIETTKGIKQGNVIEGWGGEAPWRRDSLRMTRNWPHGHLRGSWQRDHQGQDRQGGKDPGRVEEQRVGDSPAGQPTSPSRPVKGLWCI